MMNEQFLTLDDAVKVIMNNHLVEKEDEEWVRSELEQKCFFPDDPFKIGFYAGVQCVSDKINEILPEIVKESQNVMAISIELK